MTDPDHERLWRGIQALTKSLKTLEESIYKLRDDFYYHRDGEVVDNPERDEGEDRGDGR